MFPNAAVNIETFGKGSLQWSKVRGCLADPVTIQNFKYLEMMVSAIPEQNAIYINGINAGNNISVYSVNGAMVYSGWALSSNAYIYGLKSGTYIVSVNGQNKKLIYISE